MAKIKVLVLGSTGMAGHVVYFYLKNTGKYDMANAVFRKKLTEDSIILDVTDKEVVRRVVEAVHPDILINCIGVLIKGSQFSPENAILINSYFPHLLEKIAQEIGAKLIHISTDCVFSGRKGNYTEHDFRDADDIYGRSKALGEIVNDKDLTLRTSIIGPELKQNGEGLFHWFMSQRGQINGFTKAIWGGVTTLELAKAIEMAIGINLRGLVNLSNGIGISKYDLLNLFKKIWCRNDIDIIPYDGTVVNKSIALSEHFSYKVPGYEQMLAEQKAWMAEHRELYLQYQD